MAINVDNISNSTTLTQDSEHGSDYLSGQRVVTVTADNTKTGFNKLKQGILDYGIAIGDTHGDITSLQINAIQAYEDGGQIHVTFGYQNIADRLKNMGQAAINNRSDQRTVTRSTSLITVTTCRDENGNEVTLNYTNKDGNAMPEILAEMEMQVPITTYNITFISDLSSATAQSNYVGYINDDPFAGFAAHQILCSSISHTKDDDSDYYQWTVQLSCNPHTDGWDVRAYYKLPDGTIPSDLVNGTGKKLIQVQGDATFGDMVIDVAGTKLDLDA